MAINKVWKSKDKFLKKFSSLTAKSNILPNRAAANNYGKIKSDGVAPS